MYVSLANQMCLWGRLSVKGGGLPYEPCIAQHPNICLLVQHLSEFSLTLRAHEPFLVPVNLTQNTFQNFHVHETPSAWNVLPYFIYLVSFYSAIKTSPSVPTCFVFADAFPTLTLR